MKIEKNMIQGRVDKWGINDNPTIEKIKKEAYIKGFSAGRNYIKDNVRLTVSNDAVAASYQTLKQYRENLIKWVEKL